MRFSLMTRVTSSPIGPSESAATDDNAIGRLCPARRADEMIRRVLSSSFANAF